MALLAEEIVEEWLNRQGYFTIRGIKIGVHEIDLLALRIDEQGVECRHIEVQASINPVSYISRVPKSIQNSTGLSSTSAKRRNLEELRIGVEEWIDKKYHLKSKSQLRENLYAGIWTFERVVHKLRHPEELELFEDAGIKIHHLGDIVKELFTTEMLIRSASGADLVDLVLLEVDE